jgi:hypothetical protein
MGVSMVKSKKLIVAVLTADIIHSRQYSPAVRRRVDLTLRRSFKEVIRRYPEAVQTPLAFRITAGDEFQCVFADISATFEILTYLRASVATSGIEPVITFRASIGIGEISVSGKANSYEEDGEAFVRSREGLNELNKRKQAWTKIITEQPEVNRCADVILILIDRLQKNWTIPQWEAVKWSLLGLTRERISKKVKVAHQNITKRLAAAGWQEFRHAATFLKELLENTSKS